MKSHSYQHPLDVSRATASKVLGAIVHDFFPGSQLVSSQISSIGYSCTFSLTQPLDEKALPLIEERMRALVKNELPIKQMDMMRENAASFLDHHHQPFLADEASKSESNIVSLAQIGTFHDLCPEPCGETTGEAGSIKLLGLAAVDKFIRIEGTSASNPQDLKKLVKRIEAAKKNDHRILGKEMQLFFESEPDRYVWLPKGVFLKNFLVDYLKHYLIASGESEIQTPKTGNPSSSAYRAEPRDIWNLPKWFELKNFVGKSPVPAGLFQTAHTTGDRGFLFCTPEDLEPLLISSLQFIDKTIKIFGFEHHWHLSGSARKWPHGEKLRQTLENAMQVCGIEYVVDPEFQPEKGPLAELRLVDQLGREWPGATLGIDLSHTDLRYQNAEETGSIPTMVVRSVFGSIERWIALIVEKCAGRFPLWMAPEQLRVAAIGSKACAYAQRVAAQLKAEGFRVGTDYRNVNLGAKVHAAEIERVPYCVIVGEKEEKNDVVTVRTCGQETVQNGVALEALIKRLSEEVRADRLPNLGE